MASRQRKENAMRLACIIGLVCLAPTAAYASAESESSPSPSLKKHELLERRVFLPSLLGFGAGTPPVVGSTVTGFATYPTGIVSYVGGDANNGAQSSHYDAFAFNPSFDVRVGRFTIGGRVSIGYEHTVFAGVGEGSNTSFQLAPRVGYMIPLTGEVYLWPRVSAGGLYGQAWAPLAPSSAIAGFVASADVLLVAGLGSHFFLTAGPSGWVTASMDAGTGNTTFGVGASVGLGVAL
jgi:hypothetical protein